MNIGNLAVTSMKNEKKKYSFLIVNLTFAVAVSIIFSHFVCNPTLGFSGAFAQEMVADGALPIVYLFLMGTCIIVVAVALVFYANESYLQNQKKTLSIMAMSGANLVSITKYFALQHLICMLFAMIAGILISFIGLPIVNFILSTATSLIIPIFAYDISAYGIGLLIIMVMLFFLWLCDIGYVYRTDKFELTKPVATKQPDVMPGKKIFSLLGYGIPLMMIIMIPPVLQLYLVYMIIGMFGISGIFHNILPVIFEKLQKKYVYNATKSILYSNLIEAVKSNGFLTRMISISMMILSVLLCSNAQQSLTITFIAISFVIMISMMLLCIYNNMTTLAAKRTIQYSNLVLLGYDEKMIKSIIKKEQYWYFALLFLLPFVYVIISIVKFMIYQDISIIFTISVLAVFIVLIILCEKLCELPHAAVLRNRRFSS